MSTLYITTKPWMLDVAQNEIKELLGSKPKKKNAYLELKSKDLVQDSLQLLYFSRTLERVYVQANDLSMITSKKTFEVDASGFENKKELEQQFGKELQEQNSHLEVDLSKPQLTFRVLDEKTLGLDLFGFSLAKRSYKINYNAHCINTLLAQYCFSLMKLPKDPVSIIDPLANLGDMILEAGLYLSEQPLNIKDRSLLPLTLFSRTLPLPKYREKKIKLVAVVQDNKMFKQLKENINQSGVKVKVSQYELDWLDVKFKEDDFDYVVTSLPFIQDEDELEITQKELLYQSEFIAKNKIGIISRQMLSKDLIKENKLKVVELKELEVGEQQYYITVLK